MTFIHSHVLVIFVIAGIVVVSRACHASMVVVVVGMVSMSMSSITTSGEGGGPVEDELAFLVPLALVEGDEVFPAKDGSAGDAEDVADGVQTRRHHPVVLATNIHVHDPVEEVGLAVLAPERPCDDVGVVGEVGVAVLAAVDDGARRREAHQQQTTHGYE